MGRRLLQRAPPVRSLAKAKFAMGLELDGFLGLDADLGQWHVELPQVVVCRLNGDLSLVPITGELAGAMSRLTLPAASAHDTAIAPDGTPRLADEISVVRNWAVMRSSRCAVALISLSEFGDSSKEQVILWNHGSQVQEV